MGQSLQRDLDKTNESVSNVRSEIDTANTNFNELRADLTKTIETMNRIDRGVELCHAGFTGMQKGFVETGTHISNKPMTLPKLSQWSKLSVSDDQSTTASRLSS